MKHILILEDTLEVVAALLTELSRLERASGELFEVSVLSTSRAVKEVVNNQSKDTYDAIILDRNCKMGGSFHVLDIERFGPEKVVSISSIPELNRQVQMRGVKAVVDKDHNDLETFADMVGVKVVRILGV